MGNRLEMHFNARLVRNNLTMLAASHETVPPGRVTVGNVTVPVILLDDVLIPILVIRVAAREPSSAAATTFQHGLIAVWRISHRLSRRPFGIPDMG
jgi:hypothetical protein